MDTNKISLHHAINWGDLPWRCDCGNAATHLVIIIQQINIHHDERRYAIAPGLTSQTDAARISFHTVLAKQRISGESEFLPLCYEHITHFKNTNGYLIAELTTQAIKVLQENVSRKFRFEEDEGVRTKA